ncbi:MAG: cupin domain-containing protein [Acidobacteria bacterium]|nr:cupin domain-containing protein [Acidobacteriota bacterium]
MKIVYAAQQPIDRSDDGVDALRLVNREQGAKTMTAGVATFEPGSAILLHTHPCEETVIILEGQATAHVDGQIFHLRKYDTTIVPPGVPHRFLNESGKPMVIAYFYPAIDVSRDPVSCENG